MTESDVDTHPDVCAVIGLLHETTTSHKRGFAPLLVDDSLKCNDMKEVTRAWVWIVGQSSQYKEMKLEDVKSLCKEKDYVIHKNGTFFDVDEYTFKNELEPIRQYCFTIGHYEVPPHIDLVPRGTTIEYGRFIFPKED